MKKKNAAVFLGLITLVLAACGKPEVENLSAIAFKGACLLYWTDPEGKKAQKLDHIEISFSPEAETVQPVIVPLGKQRAVIDGLDPETDYVFTVKTAAAQGKPSKGIKPQFDDVYTTGSIPTENGQAAGYWKNGKAVILSENDGSYASNIALLGEDLYITGEEGGSPVMWKNGQVESLYEGTGSAYGLTIQGDDVYVSGYIDREYHEYFFGTPGYWKNGEKITLTDGEQNALAEGIAFWGPFVLFRGYDGGNCIWVDGKTIKDRFSIIVPR